MTTLMRLLLVIGLLAWPAVVSAQDLTTDLVAFWELEEASGTRVDAMGANDLSPTNTPPNAAGKVGNALDLEYSSSQHLSITDNAALSVGNIDFTMAVWVWVESTDAVNIANKTAVDGTSISYQLQFLAGPNRFRWRVASGDAFANLTAVSTTGTINTGEWYFIVAWHDATANTLNVQVNNGTADSVGYTFGGYDDTGSFLVGIFAPGGGADYFDGLIDQLGLWKRTLTTDEKTFLYNGGSGRTFAELGGESDPGDCEFFVATDGNNANPGTEAEPWLRIGYGVSQVDDGDVLCIRSGTYTDTDDFIDSQHGTNTVPSGSAGNVVTIRAYPGETVTIRATTEHQVRLASGGRHYLTFIGLIFDHVNRVGGDVPTIHTEDSTNIVFDDCHVINGAWGFAPTYDDNTSTNIRWTGGSMHGHVYYGAYVVASGVTIEDTEIYDNGGYGLHFYDGLPNDKVSNNVIRRNVLYNNAHTYQSGTQGAIIVAQGTGNLIYNNLIYDNPGTGAGITVYTNAMNTGVYNNTIYSNDGDGIRSQFSGTGNVVRNNIIYSNAGTAINDIAMNLTTSNNLTTDPDFVDDVGPTYDFRLNMGSGAIDTGTTVGSVPTDFDGIARPQGSVYDIGAYEYVQAPAGGPLRLVLLLGVGLCLMGMRRHRG